MEEKKKYEEIVKELRELLPQKEDYAELIGAEGIYYGKEYVYTEPEFVAIEAAANAIENLLKKYKNLTDAVETKDCKYCKYNDYYGGHPIYTDCLSGEYSNRLELDDKYKI